MYRFETRERRPCLVQGENSPLFDLLIISIRRIIERLVVSSPSQERERERARDRSVALDRNKPKGTHAYMQCAWANLVACLWLYLPCHPPASETDSFLCLLSFWLPWTSCLLARPILSVWWIYEKN